MKQSKSIGIQRVLQNPVLLFTASRYVGYGLQFVRGMLVAKLLGPYLLGVWGFLMLVRQYLSYTSFGVQYAVNIELAIDSLTDPTRRQMIIRVALTSTLLIAGLLSLMGLGVQVVGIPLFKKYSFNQYALALGVIAGLDHLTQVFVNVYRVYGKLFRIAAAELFTAIVPLVVALMFRGETLVWALLAAIALSALVGISIFTVRAPFEISFSLDLRYMRHLLSTGIPLLIYALSFYLITTAGRTIISIFYSVEAMGYYALANTITTATLLGLNAVIWVVFPDILSRTREGLVDEVVAKTVQKVNDLYGTSVFLAVFGMILALPLLFLFLPQYKSVEGTLDILLLSQAILSLSFGYNCMAIARKHQRKVAGISLIAVVVVTGLGLLAALFKFHYVWIAISILAGSFVFTTLQARLGARILGRYDVQTQHFKTVLPLGSFVSVLVLLVGVLSGHTMLGGLIGLAVFVITSKEKLELLWSFGVQKMVKAV